MDQIKIGNFLQVLRKEKGLTQVELANLFNISNKTVSKWECGESLPEITLLKSLAEFYNVTVDEILNGEKTNFNKPLLKTKNLNIVFTISLLTLILGYILLYVLGYTTSKSNIACFISIIVYFISTCILIAGRVLMLNKYDNNITDFSFNKLYVYIFLLIFFTTSSIAFYNIPMDVVGASVVLSLVDFLGYTALFLGIEGVLALIIYLIIRNIKKKISIKFQFYLLSIIYVLGLFLLPVYSNNYYLINLNVLASLNYLFYISVICLFASQIIMFLKFKNKSLISWILLLISSLLMPITFTDSANSSGDILYLSPEMSIFIIILPIIMIILSIINFSKKKKIE